MLDERTIHVKIYPVYSIKKKKEKLNLNPFVNNHCDMYLPDKRARDLQHHRSTQCPFFLLLEPVKFERARV